MASNLNPNNLGTNFDKELLACLQHAAELKAKNRAGERNLSELEMARNDITRLLGLIQMQQRGENRELLNSAFAAESLNNSMVTGEYQESHSLDELYENTGPGSALCARTSQLSASRSFRDTNENGPPPLPPRAPVKGAATSKTFSGSTTSSSSRSTSATSLRPPSVLAAPATLTSSQSSSALSTQVLNDCYHPVPQVTSLSIDEKVQRLKNERDRLFQSLLDESNLKDWYYAELEAVTQNIRRIPLPSAESAPTQPHGPGQTRIYARPALRLSTAPRPKKSKTVQWFADHKKKPQEISDDRKIVKVQYSLDNEAERQKLELRAQRIQQEMEEKLGSSTESQHRRKEKFESISRLEHEITSLNESRRATPSTMYSDTEKVTTRRQAASAPGRQHHVPRSANLEQLYHEAIPMDKALSHSGPAMFGNGPLRQDDTCSVISFTSSIHSLNDASMATNRRREDMDSRIEFGNSMMDLFESNDADNLSKTFLAMSSFPANCDQMRNSRIIPILVHLLHGEIGTSPDLTPEQRPSRQVRMRVAKALHNIVQAHPTDKQCKREARVLKLLETLRLYSDFLRDYTAALASSIQDISETGCCPIHIRMVPGGDPTTQKDLLICQVKRKAPGQTRLGEGGEDSTSEAQGVLKFSIPCNQFVNYSSENLTEADLEEEVVLNIEETMAVLTRCSFDEYLRQPIFMLGGIRAIAELIQIERKAHESRAEDCHNADCSGQKSCNDVRRYAVVALTNLTFGNANIKSFLCSFPGFISTMVQQLESPFEALRKATAHLFRNLAWKADKTSKQILSESNVVDVLLVAAMQVWTNSEQGKEEPTLKVVLSALWNLSAHCRKNKADICAMEGALSFLVNLLRHSAISIVENGGGILRNISSFIATCGEGERYRSILRENKCLEILLHQLKSPSLTIVSNACGTLWNLSARCQEDQRILWDLGAEPLLQSLTNSKHATISTCSLGALKNLYLARPVGAIGSSPDDVRGLPSLQARKLKNWAKDLDEKLAKNTGEHPDEDGESSEGGDSDNDRGSQRRVGAVGGEASMASRGASRCDSRDSLTSAHSDMLMYDRHHQGNPSNHHTFQQQQRGGSLDRGQPNEEGDHNQIRLRRPLPLSARHGQPSFLRPRPANQLLHDESGRKSNETQPHFNLGYQYDNHFQSFTHFQAVPGANSFQYPSENSFVPTFVGQCFVKNETPFGLDNNALAEMDQKSFVSNETNDVEDEIDEKPTDYSLRFQESEDPEYLSGNVVTQPCNLQQPPVIVEADEDECCSDAVKSYFIEATPYDTPGPISEATSVTDLRNVSDPQQTLREADEDDHFENRQSESDRPKIYCTEDTPGVFSRVESLSSIGSDDDNDYQRNNANQDDTEEEKGQLEAKLGGEKDENPMTPPLPDHQSNQPTSNHPQQKTVTFNPQETPLVFSRHSSYESLNSFDQHSIRTGYSSCDFSCAASGRVSPSDLPDSPGHSRPYSPSKFFQVQRKAHHPGTPVIQTTKQVSAFLYPQPIEPSNPSDDPMPATNNFAVTRTCFDEGDVKHFKDEGTPMIFSSRTSVSQLSFSEDDDNEEHQLTMQRAKDEARKAKNQLETHLTSVQPEPPTSNVSEMISSDDEEETNKILEEALKLGMPTKKSSQSKKPLGPPVLSRKVPKFPTPTSGSEMASPKPIPKASISNEDESNDTDKCIKQAWTVKEKVDTVEDESNLLPSNAGSGFPTVLPSSNTDQVVEEKIMNDLPEAIRVTQVKEESDSSDLNDDDEQFLENAIKLGMASKKTLPSRSLRSSARSLQFSSATTSSNQKLSSSHLSSLGQRIEGDGVPTTISARITPVTSNTLRQNTITTVVHSVATGSSKSDGESDDSDLNEDDKKFLENAMKRGLPNKKPSLSQIPSLRQSTNSLSSQGNCGLNLTTSASSCPTTVASNSETEEEEMRFLEKAMISGLPPTKQHVSCSSSQVYGGQPLMATGKSSSSGLKHRPVPPKRLGSHLSSRASSINAHESSAQDHVKIYAMEDTPINFSTATSMSDLTYDDLLNSGRESVDSQETHNLDQSYPNGSNTTDVDKDISGNVTPLQYENKDHAFKNGNNTEMPCSVIHSQHSSPGKFRSHLPRPNAVGKSESSSSSNSRTSQRKKSPVQTEKIVSHRLVEDDSSDSDEDDFLAQCLTLGLPKSKSMPVNVKSAGPRLMQKPEEKAQDQSELKRTETSGFVSEFAVPSKVAESKIVINATKSSKPGQIEPKVDLKQDHLDSQATSRSAHARRALIGSDEGPSLSTSVCSTLSTIQPPSAMENLISMTDSPEKNQNSFPPKTECRHTLSAKKGHIVPEMVRRALGVNLAVSDNSFEEMSSSLSSCQSNLDNIKPPTLMDEFDLENSIVSIASISSEVAEGDSKMETSAESNKGNMYSAELCPTDTNLNDILPPSAMNEVSGVNSSETLLAEKRPDATYTIDRADSNLATAEGDQSTFLDITDVFDESVEPTLCVGGYEGSEDVPDLPRDSRQATPSQSTPNSKESTPKTQRKIPPSNAAPSRTLECTPDKLASSADTSGDNSLLKSCSRAFEKYRQFSAILPSLDDSLSSDVTSGYKSTDLTTATPPMDGSPRTSRLRRKEDSDRFRTRTISKSDLTTPEHSPSPIRAVQRVLKDTSQELSPKKSPKQRRSEEPDRFKTHTISYGQSKGEFSSVVANLDDQFDESVRIDAQMVANALTGTVLVKRSSSADMLSSTEDRERSKTRSQSIEILDDSVLAQDFDIGSCDSTLERQRLSNVIASPKMGPRICKPGGSQEPAEEVEVRAVRGRRKPLYSSAQSPKRSTVPPTVAPKPALAPKPKKLISAPAIIQGHRISSPPTQIRGTRSSTLRQVSTGVIGAVRTSPPSPRVLQTRQPLSSTGSSASSASSKSVGRPVPSSPKPTAGLKPSPMSRPSIIRQGTFTKDDNCGTGLCSDSDASSVVSVRSNSRPNPVRRDTVHPATTRSSSLTSKSLVKPSQTRTSALRERSRSRPNSSQSASSDLQRNSSSASASSFTSCRSAVKTSGSHLNTLQNGGAPAARPMTPPKQATNEEIEHQSVSASPQTQKSTPKSNKKEVTSRIANLWKKVEDSKKKGPKEKDNKVWISKGKVIPESERALIKPDEKQREIINNFQRSKSISTECKDPGSAFKPRSKSRLSIRLSKFSLTSGSSKKSTSSNDAAAVSAPSVAPTGISAQLKAAASTPHLTNGDKANGNWVNPMSQTLRSSHTKESRSVERLASRTFTDISDARSKRMSRLGTFLNPDAETSDEENNPTMNPNLRKSNRSPSAIVTPFNYKPPKEVPIHETESNRTLEKSTSRVSSVSVKRNDSYVSSMGRIQENKGRKTEDVITDEEESPNNTSSIVVTLV